MRKLSVRPVVRKSVKRVDCDKTKERYASIFTPYNRTCIQVFRLEEWLVEDDPFYLKF